MVAGVRVGGRPSVRGGLLGYFFGISSPASDLTHPVICTTPRLHSLVGVAFVVSQAGRVAKFAGQWLELGFFLRGSNCYAGNDQARPLHQGSGDVEFGEHQGFFRGWLRLRSVGYLICREDDLKMTNLSSARHFPGFLADFPYAGHGANS